MVIFDTNVLLTFYTYPRKMVEKLFKVIECYFKIGITNRGYIEFERNKNSYLLNKNKTTIVTMLENEIKVNKKAIYDAINSLKKKNFNKFNTTYKDIISELEDEVNNKFDEINVEIGKCKSEYIGNEYTQDDDPISNFVLKHLIKKTYSKKEELKIAMEYDSRVKSNIGPGKTDKDKKPLPDDPFVRAGDYFLWKEMIEIAKKEKYIIFVTNEKKKDFWDDYENRLFSNYLLEEFGEETGGAYFKPYSLNDFLEYEIHNYIKEDQELLGFLFEKRKEYHNIFIEKTFINDYLDCFYEFDYRELENHIGDQIDLGNLEDIDDVEIEDVNLNIDAKDVDLKYDSIEDMFYAELPIIINGIFNATVNYGHFDDEDINEYYGVDFELEIVAMVSYRFDGENVFFNKLDDWEEKSFEMNVKYKETDDIDYYGPTCIICGKELTDDNCFDGQKCYECAMKEDEDE